MRGGRISGFLGRTTFFLTKVLSGVASTSEGRAVRVLMDHRARSARGHGTHRRPRTRRPPSSRRGSLRRCLKTFTRLRMMWMPRPSTCRAALEAARLEQLLDEEQGDGRASRALLRPTPIAAETGAGGVQPVACAWDELDRYRNDPAATSITNRGRAESTGLNRGENIRIAHFCDLLRHEDPEEADRCFGTAIDRALASWARFSA